MHRLQTLPSADALLCLRWMHRSANFIHPRQTGCDSRVKTLENYVFGKWSLNITLGSLSKFCHSCLGLYGNIYRVTLSSRQAIKIHCSASKKT